MAQAENHSTPRHARGKRRDDEQARRDHFQALFSEWLNSRAEDVDPTIDWTGRLPDEIAHSERQEELARQIMATPCVQPWMLLEKFEVLQHYLGCEGGTGWSDNREVAMLGGLKADVIAFLGMDDLR